MQIVKAFSLIIVIFFTCSSALRFIVDFGPNIRAISDGNPEAFGSFMAGILMTILGTGISVLLWQSIKNSIPKPSKKSEQPPIPEVPQPRSKNESKL